MADSRSPARVLVLGIGNPLRGDDGVGALLAEQAAVCTAACCAGPVAVRCVHQLTPELALELAGLDAVLFIDAALPLTAAPEVQPSLEPLPPCNAVPSPAAQEPAAAAVDSHHLEPAQLLAISQALYGRRPLAALLRVPAAQLGHGTSLSPALKARLPAARALLHQWLAIHTDAMADPPTVTPSGNADA